MNSGSEKDCLIEEESLYKEFSSSESESDNDCLDSARDSCQIDNTSSQPSHPKFSFTENPGLKVCLGDSGDLWKISICSLILFFGKIALWIIKDCTLPVIRLRHGLLTKFLRFKNNDAFNKEFHHNLNQGKSVNFPI
ncbi:hypothetical protein NPIL_335011 [Nephila pilipes]|uniref:Uncharacterized protein n=1 Tax=Nephila pilipes TaxID=299642 RepID=A0A8X6TJ51_NEPPI|nr:hypothetical protein NPIL_335011 [Nephila pilipes]